MSNLCDPMDCSTSGFPVHHQLLANTIMISVLAQGSFFDVGGYPVHCRMFRSLPGLYPLDSSSTLPPPQLWTPKISADTVSVSWGQKWPQFWTTTVGDFWRRLRGSIRHLAQWGSYPDLLPTAITITVIIHQQKVAIYSFWPNIFSLTGCHSASQTLEFS